MIYYRYNPLTRVLKAEPNYITTAAGTTVNPSAAQWAAIGAYPRADDPAPAPQEGKVAMLDDYEVCDGAWHALWRYDDAPTPTLAEFDAAMEQHLYDERAARGYTTREPDTYLNSSVPRWAQDARDWVAHRDAVMGYALALINAVESGERDPPTMAEFKAGLPCIQWTYQVL